MIEAATLGTGSDAVLKSNRSQRRQWRSLSLVALMVLSTMTTIDFITEEVSAASDLDGDGLTYGLEYLINTAATDWDSDNDGLPDGWDGNKATPQQRVVMEPSVIPMEMECRIFRNTLPPTHNWDNPATTGVLDNGVCGMGLSQSMIGMKKIPCNSINRSVEMLVQMVQETSFCVTKTL